jgi:hypothetical protein
LHDFHEILAVAMGAVPCKGQGSVDMGLFAKAKEPFLRGFLKLENGVPSHATPELAEGQPAFPQARSGAVPGGVSAVHDGLQQNDAKPVVDAGHSRFESPAATVSPMSRGW